MLAVGLLALIAPFVVYAVPGTVGAEASYIVLTASMTPAIAPGDVVIVDDVPARLVEVDDVIVFEQQAGATVPVTHRVIDIERAADGTPSFATKGDANEDADLTPVTPDRLVGRVLFTIPLIGHVIQFVDTPTGFVALVVLPLGLLIASEVADLLRSGRTPEPAVSEVDGDDGDGDGVTVPPASGRADTSSTGGTPDDRLTFTPADLTLSSAVLGIFAVYAGYAAYTRPSGVTVGIAVAVGAGFALVVGLRSFVPPAPVVADDGPPVTAPEVSVDPGTTAGPSVVVGTPADLGRIADAVGRPLLRADADRYVVFDGTVTYSCTIPAAAEETPDVVATATDDGTTDGTDVEDRTVDAGTEGPVYGPTPPAAPTPTEDEPARALTPDGGDRP
ncbi:hypothetical protein JCM17092_21600 [Haloplanus litoreus]